MSSDRRTVDEVRQERALRLARMALRAVAKAVADAVEIIDNALRKG